MDFVLSRVTITITVLVIVIIIINKRSLEKWNQKNKLQVIMSQVQSMPERIYKPIMAMGFLAMFTFQLDNTKR